MATAAPSIAPGLDPGAMRTPPDSEALSIIAAGLSWSQTFTAAVTAAAAAALDGYGPHAVDVTAYEWHDVGRTVTRVTGTLGAVDDQAVTVSGRRILFDRLAALHLHS